MLEASAIINIFFTVIKIFSFVKFLMQTAIMVAFPISFTVTDLWFVSSPLLAYLTN